MSEDRRTESINVERIARLEAMHEETRNAVEEIRQDVKMLRGDWNKARGVIGGVIFVVSSLWAFFISIWNYLSHGGGTS